MRPLSVPPPWPRHTGHSLHEFLTTLAVAGVVATGAAGLKGLLAEQRLTSEVNQLLADLSLARSEAIKRGKRAVLCPSGNGLECAAAAADFAWWQQGYLLFVDDNENSRRDGDEPVLRVQQEAGGGTTVKTSRSRDHITYRPDGLASGSNATFTFCDARGSDRVRYVIISNSGRPRFSPQPADGRVDEALERCP